MDDRRHAFRAGVRYWTPYGLAAAAVFLAVGFSIHPVRPTPSTPRPRAPSVHYLPPAPLDPGLAAGLKPDARSIWSPVLFSLPTPVGFSRNLPHAIGARPPGAPPPPPPAFLERAQSLDALPPAARRVGSREAAERLAAFRSASASTLEDLPVARAVKPMECIVYPEGWNAQSFDAQLFPAGTSGASNAWTATAWVSFNSRGTAEHVVIEESTASTEALPDMARRLYRWRLKSNVTPRAGRLAFQFAPAVEPTALPKRETP